MLLNKGQGSKDDGELRNGKVCLHIAAIQGFMPYHYYWYVQAVQSIVNSSHHAFCHNEHHANDHGKEKGYQSKQIFDVRLFLLISVY